MRGAEHHIMASNGVLQGLGVVDIDILDHHSRTLTQFFRGIAGNGRDAVTTTQGFFQQLAAGTTGSPDDCDFAHDILQ